MNKRILIRSDASSRIGAGHLMRMLALGQLLSDSGYEVHFATIPYNPPVLSYLKDEPFQLHYLAQEEPWDACKDLERLLNLALEIRPLWLVLDGYQFRTDYEKGIKDGGFRLFRVQDIPASHCVADVLLNQNYGAEHMKHSTEPNTYLLAGLKYSLLRREFRTVNLNRKRFLERGRFHLLVSLGGGSEISDSLNLKIVEGLSEIRECDWSATLIVGIMGQRSKTLMELANKSSMPIQVITENRNIAFEMLKSDLAIVSCGSTMWELMYMKVPFLVVSLTEVQRDYLAFLAGEGLCVDLGWYENLTPKRVRDSVLALADNVAQRGRMLEQADKLLDRDNICRELLKILNTETGVLNRL